MNSILKFESIDLHHYIDNQSIPNKNINFFLEI